MKNINLSRFLLLCGLCITLSSAQAQYVAIPDSNFGNWLLNNGYSSCLTGNSVSGFRLDTTSLAVLNATSLSPDVQYQQYPIIDFTGVQYFKGLQTFSCNYFRLTSLPPLPPTLTSLSCNGGGYIASLPSLPPTLQSLNCDYNQLDSLPALPATLQSLDCGSNNLNKLPALPTSLTYLNCGFNFHLTALPPLPASLGTLVCDEDSLLSLPSLPASLSYLNCTSNNIYPSLPTLPPHLTQLICGGNPLTSLPSLPASLDQLICEQSILFSLPELPAGLTYLDCNQNYIHSLPSLPSHLVKFICDSNYLSYMPNLPDSMTYFSCSNNAGLFCLPRFHQTQLSYIDISRTNIRCVPNRINAVQYGNYVNPDTMPLCSISSGCDFIYTISGNVHLDMAGSCGADSLSEGPGLGNIKVQLIHGGEVVQQLYTLTSGEYSFKPDSLTDYEISVDTFQIPFRPACPTSGSYNVSLSQSDSLSWNDNFGMICSTGDQYKVLSISGHFRPYYIHQISIEAGNVAQLAYGAGCSASDSSGTITTTFTGPAQYTGPAPGSRTPSIVSGNTLVYNVAKLDSLNSHSLDIMVLVDSNAAIGAQVCFTVVIMPSNPHEHGDTLTECFAVQNSYDPNNKSVSPAVAFEAGGWLTYTVEFQNTGNDTAYTVVVRDTLSQYVDPTSFQYIASDHKAVVQLFGNAMAFTFPKINLVDSATNPRLSTGWIQYRVKAKANLPLNTQVSNTAYIYFDHNPAIVTNTAVTNASLTGIGPVAANNRMQLYPNPNKGTFTLQTANSIGSTYIITDMLGHIITHQTITADKQSIYMDGVVEGVYTLAVKGATPLRFTIMK